MKLDCFILSHPQSPDLLTDDAFVTRTRQRRIACGTSRVATADLSEANDFHPTYAGWNTCLFETSVILTLWEHADELIGDNCVAILHSDIEPHFEPEVLWQQVTDALAQDKDRAVGLVVSTIYQGIWDEWLVPPDAKFRPRYDPMLLHAFDSGIYVWDYIKKYDPDMHAWAMETQPRMLYAHQFACSRQTFDVLGAYLHGVASRMRLGDIGFWTPHVFERLIALFLARHGGEPVLTTAFWHHSGSGSYGPGDHSLYGPRPRRFYRTSGRAAVEQR